MRTEEEIREQLSDLRATQKYALENRQIWQCKDYAAYIDALKWVLGEIEEI